MKALAVISMTIVYLAVCVLVGYLIAKHDEKRK